MCELTHSHAYYDTQTMTHKQFHTDSQTRTHRDTIAYIESDTLPLVERVEIKQKNTEENRDTDITRRHMTTPPERD